MSASRTVMANHLVVVIPDHVGITVMGLAPMKARPCRIRSFGRLCAQCPHLQLRGKKGTKVTLTILRKGAKRHLCGTGFNWLP